MGQTKKEMGREQAQVKKHIQTQSPCEKEMCGN